MPKLIVDLNRFRNVIYGCVKHLDDDLRDTDRLARGEDEAGYTYDIYSAGGRPMFCDGGYTLYVWGRDRDTDRHAFAHVFDSEEEAERVEAKYLQLIEEVNNGTATI